MDVFRAVAIPADRTNKLTGVGTCREAARMPTAPMDVETNPAYKKRVFSIRPIGAHTRDAPVVFVDADVLATDLSVENEKGVVVGWALHLVATLSVWVVASLHSCIFRIDARACTHCGAYR